MNNKLLNSLDKTIDSRLDNLDIFNLSLENALIYLLRVFEDRCRFSLIPSPRRKTKDIPQLAHHLAREGMDALSVLLPLVYGRCQPTNKINLKSCKEKKYEQAGNAIEIAYAYSCIRNAMQLAKIGTYIPKKKNKDIYFLPSRGSINYDARAQIISFSLVEDEADFLTENFSSELLPLLLKHLSRGISSLIPITKLGSLLYKIPGDVLGELTKMVEHIIQHKWTLIDSIQLEKYSVGEAKQAWSSIIKLAVFHNIVCLSSGLPGIGMEYLPGVIARDDLVNWLNADCGVSKQKISAMISDLTFNQNICTDEIMFQPLLPLNGAELLIFAPNIIIFSNPERNLMKLWARIYPGIYGAKISTKGKAEERIVANMFKKINSDLIVINSRKLKDGGRIITDIDVAVYNKVTHEVLFIQLKWFLKPDGPAEVRSADNKLNDGMDQLNKVSNYIDSKEDAFEKIFNYKIVKPKTIYMCVLSSSNVGSFWARKDFDVFNQEIVMQSLENYKFSSIADMYKKWRSLHSFKPYFHFKSVFQVLRYKDERYLLPATEFISHKNIWKKLVRYPMYFIFEIIFKGCHFIWPKRENPNIFAKKG